MTVRLLTYGLGAITFLQLYVVAIIFMIALLIMHSTALLLCRLLSAMDLCDNDGIIFHDLCSQVERLFIHIIIL